MSWRIYDGKREGTPEAVLQKWLRDPPPWREMPEVNTVRRAKLPETGKWLLRGSRYVASGDDEIDRVNIALLLRRPILVTGRPGVGKSSLAYNIAWALDLGPPLRWEINSQSTLQDGLYTYDAVEHLRATQAKDKAEDQEIGNFITLGPLGTALLPTDRPRVLLIDELDKASFDLPNDLLNVFEEGSFDIPEIVRAKTDQAVHPRDRLPGEARVKVGRGRVSTKHHPVVVITSNGERVFPEAFRRRCVSLDLLVPPVDRMREIIRRQLGPSVKPDIIDHALHASGMEDAAARRPPDSVLQEVFVRDRFGVPAEVARKGTLRD